MRKKKGASQHVARELSAADIERLLAKIGKALKARREKQTTLEKVSYELGMSRSQVARYEEGNDMYLSTFLKLTYGLDIDLSEFFEEIK